MIIDFITPHHGTVLHTFHLQMDEDLNFTHYVRLEHKPLLLHNESGLEDKRNVNLATDSRVAGRIKGNHKVYKEVEADKYIIEVVKNCYKKMILLPVWPRF